MRKPPSQNILTTLELACISRQNKRSCFHSQPQFVQRLQGLKDLSSVLSSHSKLLKSGSLEESFSTNQLINAYVRFQEIENAHQLFDEMSEPNVVSWTSLMAGYVDAGCPGMALWLFTKMARCTVLPNAFTFSTIINACSVLADVNAGKKVHAQVEVYGYQCNLVVCCSLIDMYGKSNSLDAARRVFDSMIERNVVSWTSMVTGYTQNAQGYEALELFKVFTGISSNRPNHYMLASIVNACASLGRLAYGKATHAAVIKQKYETNDVIACALVDMYAKCGCIGYSLKVFRRNCRPSVIPYTCMIIGAAKHGLGILSLELFQEMLMRKIAPNRITFVGVLYACSHSGLVDEGLKHLNTMYKKHGVLPDAMHYNCVVDMLGRTGRLDEAYRLAKSIEVDQNQGALLWGALLSASRLHGRVDIAAEASNWLMESKQQVAAAYVTMSNTYAVAGTWDDVNSTRCEMKRAGVKKEPGCSWVEIKDAVFVFYAGDVSSCARGSKVLILLKELERKMKKRGYVAGSNGLVFVDVEEEAKEEIVSLHSERLALGFSLLSMPKGVTIRIMKNLRVCRDCHEAFKLISDIVHRDFVVRDVNRFHHFAHGSCSCCDFW
ncbi:hypothetical protein Nepgr_030262 [Nepenthes gracilis]|uniref:DYW domain-containing protein n=1 Tax=Nepenthes gracilis TaxID=150966 RepID=A0AAD3TFU9_NEPGR|nr:hypothetical protein Nepgr_030262 [Nepenthes gracilis]